MSSVPWIPDAQQWGRIVGYLLRTLSVRDQALVLLAHDGALRREEIVRLRVDDIDWRTHTVAVRATITKNHVPGTIVLSNVAYAKLKNYVTGDRAVLVNHFDADPAGPIFLSDSRRNPGQPLTKWTVKDIFDRIREAVGMPRLTPHTMRHLMLTELKRSGLDLLDVSRYGRHRSVISTEIYLHTDLSDLARSVQRAHARLERAAKEVRPDAEFS
jgi:integrase